MAAPRLHSFIHSLVSAAFTADSYRDTMDPIIY